MIDPQIIQPLMFGSFALGIIIGIFPKSIGKIIAFFSAIPLISFLLFISSFPSQEFSIQDLSTVIPWMIENIVVLGIAFACESAGTGIVGGIKKRFFNNR